MFNIDKIKRNAASLIRKEMKEVQDRYVRAGFMMEKIIEENPMIDQDKITIEEYQKRQMKMLWELVYEPYYNELSELIKKINQKDGPKQTS